MASDKISRKCNEPAAFICSSRYWCRLRVLTSSHVLYCLLNYRHETWIFVHHGKSVKSVRSIWTEGKLRVLEFTLEQGKTCFTIEYHLTSIKLISFKLLTVENTLLNARTFTLNSLKFFNNCIA